MERHSTSPGSLAALGKWIQDCASNSIPLVSHVASRMPAIRHRSLVMDTSHHSEVGVTPPDHRQQPASSSGPRVQHCRKGGAQSALRVALRNRGGAQKHPDRIDSCAHRQQQQEEGGQLGILPLTSSPFAPLPQASERKVPRLHLGYAGFEAAPLGPSAAEVNTSRGPQVTARGSHTTLAAQLDEFLHRGTPRVTARRGMPVASLEERFSIWAESSRLVPGDVWLASCRQIPVVQPVTEGNDAIVHEVCIIFYGVELLLKIVAQSKGGLLGASETVTSAYTRCRWSFLNRCLAAASLAAEGGPIEDFLNALLLQWSRNEGQRNDVYSLASTETATAAHSGYVDALQTDASEQDSSYFDRSPGSDALSESVASFNDWLGARPPLWRFDHAGKGLAWDFPPSKAEKRELLLLQLFAEEGERQVCVQEM